MPSVIDYVRKTDEESVPISSDRERAESVQKCKHAHRDREPSRIRYYKKAPSLLSEGKVIRKTMVHCIKKKVLSSFELRKCLSLAFRKYIAVGMSRLTCRPQLRHNKSSRVGDSNRRLSYYNKNPHTRTCGLRTPRLKFGKKGAYIQKQIQPEN